MRSFTPCALWVTDPAACTLAPSLLLLMHSLSSPIQSLSQVVRWTWLLVIGLLLPAVSYGQSGYDASWYDPVAPHVKIAVVEDGVYRVSAGALEDAGVPASVDPTTFRLLMDGREVPIDTESGDLIFVGERNRGTQETWAYDGDAAAQSSTYYSLFSDTTFYWLTWGGAGGVRYQSADPDGGATTAVVRDTLHREQDNTYFYGQASGDPRYTLGEGYYWTRFSINTAGNDIEQTVALNLDRFAASAGEDVTVRVRLMGTSGSDHRVRLAVEPAGGGGALATDEATWSRYALTTLSATIPAASMPSDGALQVRLTSLGDAAFGTPNYVSLDWIEASYPRTLAAEGASDAQRFTVASGAYTFSLSGHTDPVTVYAAAPGHRYEATAQGDGTVAFDASPPAPTTFWAVGANGYRSPADVRLDTPSDWAAGSNAADYVILTTPALQASATDLASYRETESGYSTVVVDVQDVFDQFDYGRPTPVAIRRFFRATQGWQTAPRFVAIWADAPYPVSKSGGVPQPRPKWGVPSFGYGPSDGWFAMQAGGANDWSEVVAIGRIPIRTNDDGALFLEKLRTYERAPLADWQKRMLMLAGGTSAGEQNTLQFYTTQWAEAASSPTGADTLYYFKNVNDALDTSFQDSLRVDLQRGSGWLNYFGHSAAQTWEIVTDPPDEFDNAGRLPFVVSLACKTGSFAGGRFEDRNAPSLGEALVVGTLDGGIAHWGTSELGNITPSARLNTALFERVFRDTLRVMGPAIQDAKAEIAASFDRSDLYIRHLLQYGLLGDPALRLALPTQPDFDIATSRITTQPETPTPGDSLTASARFRNRGLIPADSVDVTLTRTDPVGQSSTTTRRLPPFALETAIAETYFLDEQAIGANTLRAAIDPDDVYSEANEANNEATQTQVIFRTGVELITPRDNGIVNQTQPTLRVQLTGGSQPGGSRALELDSTAGFDSGALQQTTQPTDTFVIDWQPSRALENGVTYYWRARQTAGTEAQDWTTGTFTVQSGQSPGWLQQGARLATNSEQVRLAYDDGGWGFTTFPLEVLASSEEGSGALKGRFQVGSQIYENIRLGFGVLVIDDKTGAVLDHGSYCTYDVADQFLDAGCTDGLEQSEAIAALEALLANVEPGDYVFTRTRHLGRAGGSTTIPDAVKTAFRTLGTSGDTYSTAIDTLAYTDLWVMQTRKGSPDATVEVAQPTPPLTGDTPRDIVLRGRLDIPHASGQLTTGRIGPAQEWDEIAWEASPSSPDSRVQIDVLSGDGSTVLVPFDALETASPQPLDDIDPATHPYLRLRATLTDSTDRVPPQLGQWQINYMAPPELSGDVAALQAIPDTLEEGATPSVTIPIQNLSGPPASDVIVRYELTDAANQTTIVGRDTLGTLASGEVKTSSASFTTTDRGGANRLTAQIERSGAPEPIAYNNTLVGNFFVASDETPPTLKVLVEGRELPADPEPVTNLQDPSLPFVSVTPTIEILVGDDSNFFPLADTSLTEVRLDGKLVPFSSPTLQFEAASADNNEARIVFTPDLSGRDTTHTLRVEAEDPRGNRLPDPYQVHFRVQQDQVVRDLYPYPNPMNTHTTFAFRVEGGTQQPEDFRLRIYTLSGRLIRAFRASDVNDGGGLRVGWNTLRWNGRDADGDRVATGVYLYRVVVRGESGTFEGDVEKVAVIR